MRKITIVLLAMLFPVMWVKAQEDYVTFFPKEKGATLVKNNYDACGKLLSTTTYVVSEAYKYPTETSRTIDVTIKDVEGNVIGENTMEIKHGEAEFYIKIINIALIPEVITLLGGNTEITGDLLDYPDIFATIPSEEVLEVTKAEFSIYSKSSSKNRLAIQVYNRQFVKEEKVVTPSGAYDAYKITFDLELKRHNTVTKYKGVEWYTDNAGIIKAELYDTYNHLVRYSELTRMRLK